MKTFRIFSLFLLLLICSYFVSKTETGAGEKLASLTSGLDVQAAWFRNSDRLDQLETLQRIVGHIHESYVEPNRVDPSAMLRKALEEISQSVAEVRVIYPVPNKAVLLVDQARMEIDLNLKSLFNLPPALSDALKFVRANKKSDISDRDLEITAINGMLSTLDPHSVYLTSDLYDETKVGTTGKFGGLGIVIGLRDSKLIIIAPLENTPAWNAGLKSGDQIVKIGEELTMNMSLSDAVDKMRGPKGSSVTITVMRSGWTTEKAFTMVRDIINIVSVDADLLPNGIGYVRVKNFQGNTEKDLSRHLQDLNRRAGGTLKGLILDLRGDPGGLLDQAIGVADKFLADGPIVTTVGAANRIRDEEKATEPGTEPGYPMAVLTDQGSASASEIVAGALKRRERSIIIGQRTFGKGTVQSLFELPEDSALKLTIAQYLTPGGVSIQSVGIAPDIKLVPAIVSKDYIDLYRKREFEEEASLEHHFDNPRAEQLAKEKVPVAELTYLETLDDNEDTRLARAAGTLPPEERLKDFYVKVAFELLKDHPNGKRDDLLKAAKGYAERSNRIESQKVIEALKTKAIDWAPLPTKRMAQNCVPPTASWKFSPSRQKPVMAGETLQLAVTLANPSNCTLYQARASTDSKNYLLNNHEFLFGKLAPGESITRESKIVVPKSMPSSLTSFEIDFFEAQKITPKPILAEAAVQAIAKPKFAFALEINDSTKKGLKGNNDGLVSRGETVEFRVKVKNVGEEASEGASGAIKPIGDRPIQISISRSPLGKMKPGEEKSVSFLATVPQTYPERSFQVEFAALDPVYRVSSIKRFTVDIGIVGNLIRESTVLTLARREIPIRTLPSSSSSLFATLSQPGTFLSDARYGDYYRVSLPTGKMGWISNEDTQPSSEKVQTPISAVRWYWFKSPVVTADTGKWIYTPVNSQFFPLQGTVTDDEKSKDVFIFVNGKKVFYQSFPGNQKPAAKESFETSIPLDIGINRVVLVGRNNQDLIQQDMFVVHRKGTSAETADQMAKPREGSFSHDEYLMDPLAP